MNSLTISFVLVRLAAVFLFVRGVQGLSAFSYLLTGTADVATFAVVTLVFSVILPVAIAIVLWLYPEKVTGAQVTGTRAEESISAQQILLIGISLMGLYILIYGIVDLFKVESLLALQRQRALTSNFSLEFYEGQAIVDRITYLIQIVLGFLMVLGRNSLSRLILKVRYAGVTKTD